MPKFELLRVPPDPPPSPQHAPWHVAFFADSGEILFVYNPIALNHQFIRPTRASEPHPNRIGRLIADAVHDVCHVYQADALLALGSDSEREEKLLEHRFHGKDYSLSICGLAEAVSFKICGVLWERARNINPSRLKSARSLEEITSIITRRTFRQPLRDALLWRLAYSYRAAIQKGWFRGSPSKFPPLFLLPRELRPSGREAMASFQLDPRFTKSAMPRMQPYDLGIYVGALLEVRHKLSLRDLIQNPMQDRKLLRIAGIRS